MMSRASPGGQKQPLMRTGGPHLRQPMDTSRAKLANVEPLHLEGLGARQPLPPTDYGVGSVPREVRQVA